jgi:hypothetical protein
LDHAVEDDRFWALAWLAGDKISSTPNEFLVLCFSLFFIHVIIFFSCNGFSLLFLPFERLGIITLVNNIIGVVDSWPFLAKAVWVCR